MNKNAALIGLFPKWPRVSHGWKSASCFLLIIKDKRMLVWNVVRSRSTVFKQGDNQSNLKKKKKRVGPLSSIRSDFTGSILCLLADV